MARKESYAMPVNYVPLDPMHRNNYQQLRGIVDLLLHLPTNLLWAEIGCYDGASSELWMMKCAHLYCIDRWDWTPEFYNVETPAQVEGRFDLRMRAFSGHFTKLKGYSSEVISKIPDNHLNGVYIDGFHSREAVEQDIALCLPKLKTLTGGYITGHDYGNPATPGVAEAVDNVIGGPDVIFMDWSWMKQIHGRWSK